LKGLGSKGERSNTPSKEGNKIRAKRQRTKIQNKTTDKDSEKIKQKEKRFNEEGAERDNQRKSNKV
jgi:hypothetical protein